MSSVTPASCVRGCGFFGTAENGNMCSRCYTDYLKQEIIAKTKFTPEKSNKSIDYDTHQSIKIETCVDNNNNNNNNNKEEETAKTGPPPVVKNRCDSCSKKVGVTGFACRCGKVFCGTHRYPKEHSCTFDFKKVDRDLLVKQNPLLKGDKIENRL